MHERTRERGRARHRDLLAENRPHTELERIERARHAHAAVRAYERAQLRVTREMAIDRLGVGIEVEEAADAGDQVHEPFDGRQVRAQAQCVLARNVPHLDHTGRTVDIGDTAVHVRVEINRLDAGNRARREEREQRGPCERRPVGHAQLEAAVDHEPVGHASLGAQLARCELEDLEHDPVHLPHAVETGSDGDLRHRQVRVVEQAAGEVRAARTCDFGRGRAHVLGEEPAQMARAHTEPRRKIVFGHVVEHAVGDGVHRAADELRRGDPTDLGNPIGAAAQARPKPRGFGRGRVVERARVPPQRLPGAADRAAVDTSSDDSGERVHDPVLGDLARHIRTRGPFPHCCPDLSDESS